MAVTKKTEEIFNEDYICDYFKLNEYERFFVKKKYKNNSHTIEEWENLFKNDKLSIK